MMDNQNAHTQELQSEQAAVAKKVLDSSTSCFITGHAGEYLIGIMSYVSFCHGIELIHGCY